MIKKHPTYKNAWYALAVSRILLGFIFLWAFLDKTFGLGFSTEAAKSWLSGTSPTAGFLSMGVNPDSPVASVLNGMSGSAVVDVLFMFGLLGLGIALILGVGLRIAAVGGTILMLMMWIAQFPLATNPLIDEHIIYASMLWVFALARREWSLSNWWINQDFVKKNSWLW